MARQAGEVGGTAPTVLNAANEVAVAEFLSGRLAFSKIPLVVEQVLSLHQSQANPTLETIFAVDTWARDQVMQVMSKE